jgi:hypothetical protein
MPPIGWFIGAGLVVLALGVWYLRRRARQRVVQAALALGAEVVEPPAPLLERAGALWSRSIDPRRLTAFRFAGDAPDSFLSPGIMVMIMWHHHKKDVLEGNQ